MRSIYSSLKFLTLLVLGAMVSPVNSQVPDKVIEVKASTREERTKLANLGYALEDIRSDRVFIYGLSADSERLKRLGFSNEAHPLKDEWLSINSTAAPGAARYKSYEEVVSEMGQLAQSQSQIVTLTSLGQSLENRNIPLLRISGRSLSEASSLNFPVIFYTGCHHAREHLSVETPLLWAKYLVNEYGRNPDVTRLVDSREIYIAPIINPDGHVYDYSDGLRGKMWRKNRAVNSDSTFGVDLNRNYGFQWGTGGSSNKPRDDTYMGPVAFSEPETQAVRNFVNSQSRMTTLLSFHTFSELILYPWGHSHDKIGEVRGNPADLPVFEKMARTMAGWNQYKPEQSSDLYIASGDTTDWAYGEHGIFAFTFELSPKSQMEGGFYPHPRIIEPTFDANVKPLMYLLEYADNPHRVLSETTPNFSLSPARLGIGMASFSDLNF